MKLFPDGADIDVTELSTRGKVIREMFNTCKRAVELLRCVQWQHEADPETLPHHPPYLMPASEQKTMEVQMRNIWGGGTKQSPWNDNFKLNPEYRAWDVVFEMWATGSIERQIISMCDNLPDSLASEVMEELEKIR